MLFNYQTRGEVDPGSGPGMTEFSLTAIPRYARAYIFVAIQLPTF